MTLFVFFIFVCLLLVSSRWLGQSSISQPRQQVLILLQTIAAIILSNYLIIDLLALQEGRIFLFLGQIVCFPAAVFMGLSLSGRKEGGTTPDQGRAITLSAWAGIFFCLISISTILAFYQRTILELHIGFLIATTSIAFIVSLISWAYCFYRDKAYTSIAFLWISTWLFIFGSALFEVLQCQISPYCS